MQRTRGSQRSWPLRCKATQVCGPACSAAAEAYHPYTRAFSASLVPLACSAAPASAFPKPAFKAWQVALAARSAVPGPGHPRLSCTSQAFVPLPPVPPPAATVWLLSRGASVLAQKEDSWKDSCLHYAGGSGSLETVQALLAWGADPKAQNALGEPSRCPVPARLLGMHSFLRAAAAL